MPNIPQWARAHGPVVGYACIRMTPEDFRVEEILGFEADGEGEHLLLKVEKRGANTLWVARELARYTGISPRQISYAGTKDRHAVAIQHFSLWLGKRAAPDWAALEHAEFRVLSAAPHRRKLRVGSLRGNRFRVVMREISIPVDALVPRLESIRQQGVPNYFGPQRFGHDGANVARVAAMFSGEQSVHDRKLRGLLLSAARSLIFNAVLSQRVSEHTWDRVLAGDICMLDGSHSMFHAENVDATLIARAQAGNLHPTGPLWGMGEKLVSGEVAALETPIIRDHAVFTKGLEASGLEQARRSLRVLLKDLTWTADDSRTLTLEFFLPAGAYATAVIRELTDTRDLGEGVTNAHAD